MLAFNHHRYTQYKQPLVYPCFEEQITDTKDSINIIELTGELAKAISGVDILIISIT